jgi:hypothetical protein
MVTRHVAPVPAFGVSNGSPRRRQIQVRIQPWMDAPRNLSEDALRSLPEDALRAARPGARAAPHASRPSAREASQPPAPLWCARSAARFAPKRARSSPAARPEPKRAISLGRPDHDQRSRLGPQELTEQAHAIQTRRPSCPALSVNHSARNITRGTAAQVRAHAPVYFAGAAFVTD